MEMKSGIVNHWDLWRGFGFIAPDEHGAPEVHARVTVLEGFRGYPHLAKGERVLFESEAGKPAANGTPRETATRVCPVPGVLHGKVDTFDSGRGFGFIIDSDGEYFFLHHSNLVGRGVRTVLPGDEVSFIPGEGSPDREALEVKPCDPRKALYRFTEFTGDLDRWFGSLARRAASENWAYQYELQGRGGRFPVLRHYLEETFRALEMFGEDYGATRRGIFEGEVSGEKYASFNTGLVTPEGEAIYALLMPTRSEAKTPWYTKGFFTATDRPFQAVSEHDFPASVEYRKTSDNIFYEFQADRDRKLEIDCDRIARDLLDRFPEPLKSDPELARETLVRVAAALPQQLKDNEKIAIPQFHFGQVQPLLPLALLDPSKVDFALLIQRREGHAYFGSTILGLDAARRAARVIGPPGEWLA